MAIEFHCDRCGKKVRTADDSAGRRGRCPYCKQSVYIPTPSNQIELLDMIPLDETDEQRRARMLDETRNLASNLLRDRELPPEPARAHIADAARDVIVPKADMETLIIEYAGCMASGDLKTADELAAEIRQDIPAAEAIMDRIAIDEMPPAALAAIPRPVLIGFFKRLRAK